jgi:hypothetical protein
MDGVTNAAAANNVETLRFMISTPRFRCSLPTRRRAVLDDLTGGRGTRVCAEVTMTKMKRGEATSSG